MVRSFRAARGAKSLLGLLFFPLLLALAPGCGSGSRTFDPASDAEPPKKLSALGLFVGDGRAQVPQPGVIPYDLNSPLFSDYTSKYRFVKMPAGTQAKYDAEKAFDFPVGTVIAKTFAYPHDMRDPAQGERLLETRILMHRPQGWVGMAYVWNQEQNEAVLELAGGTVDAEWIHSDGQKRTNQYLIPNANQCKSCHKTDDNIRLLPVGPKARHLNRDLIYDEDGKQVTENQLAHWTRIGALAGAPADPAEAPRLAAWNDPSSGTLDERARAWLEINCAHCHNPGGHARNSGLNLLASEKDPFRFGIFKPPVAAGRGSGGLRYDIVPGKPDESIMIHRMASTEAQVMMPELGKRLVHEESLALVREWIAAMPPVDPAAP